jgi:hypothetical protein
MHLCVRAFCDANVFKASDLYVKHVLMGSATTDQERRKSSRRCSFWTFKVPLYPSRVHFKSQRRTIAVLSDCLHLQASTFLTVDATFVSRSISVSRLIATHTLSACTYVRVRTLHITAKTPSMIIQGLIGYPKSPRRIPHQALFQDSDSRLLSQSRWHSLGCHLDTFVCQYACNTQKDTV